MYFDGLTYLTGPSLSGSGYSSTKLIVHGWFYAGDDTPSQGYILRESGGTIGHVYIRQETNGRLTFRAETAAGALVATANPAKAFLISDGWVSFDWVIDSVAGFNKVYYDLVEVATSTPTASAIIDLEGAGWNLGSRVSGTDKITANIDQIYIGNNFTTDYVSSTGELTAKYIAEMYDFDQNGTIFRKFDSIATAVSSPIILLEQKTYSDFLTNDGSSGTDWALSSGDLLPASEDNHIGTWTFTG